MVKKIIMVISLFLLIAGCSPKASQTAVSEVVPKPESKPELVKAAWELEMDKVQSGAKKEGKLVIYGTLGGEPRVALIESFREKYGIAVEWVIGRGADISTKIISERKAGIYLADVYIGGATTPVTQLKPAGVLDVLDPVLFLPEIKDPKAWWGGKPLFIDPDHYIFAFIASPYPTLTINTNMVKTGELKSYRDLLQPKWKKNFILSDPTIAGAAHKWFMVESLPERMGMDYMRKLAEQEPLVTKDERLQIEWVSHGKYPLLVAGKTDPYIEFKSAGAPIDRITPEEGTFLQSASGSVGLMNKAPHPNAAKLYVNWLLSREGQTALSKVYTFQSARLDVTTQYVDPLNLRHPGLNYFWGDTEEFLLKGTETAKIAEGVFGHLIK